MSRHLEEEWTGRSARFEGRGVVSGREGITQVDMQVKGEIIKGTDRQADRQTDRQTNRQTDREVNTLLLGNFIMSECEVEERLQNT